MVIESLGLPMFENIETLAEEIRLTEKLVYFLTKEDAEGRYVKFCVPKKDGTSREINAPCMALKVIQRWVLENILYKVRVSQYSIGFAKNGKGSPYILKMDLKNFFPSVKRDRIFTQFLQLGYNTYASNLEASSVCVKAI